MLSRGRGFVHNDCPGGRVLDEIDNCIMSFTSTDSTARFPFQYSPIYIQQDFSHIPIILHGFVT